MTIFVYANKIRNIKKLSKMTTRETIQRAIEILKSVRRKSNFDLMLDWEVNNGYDPIFDKQMKSYFAIVNPLDNVELREAMCDVWNATLQFYYTEPKNEECEIEKALSEKQRIQRSVTSEDKARGVATVDVVTTNKGQKVLITYNDGSKALRKLYEEPKKEEMLNFDACEKELIDLAEFGSHDFRSALAALVAKYHA